MGVKRERINAQERENKGTKPTKEKNLIIKM